MKHAAIGALVAVVVTLVTVRIADDDDDDAPDAAQQVAQPAEVRALSSAGAPAGLRYTDELVEDAWVNGARTAGTDNKPLADASSSICFLTRIEISGVQGPADSNACAITIDEFTGFWEVTATVEDGGQSQVRCNARCLVWD